MTKDLIIIALILLALYLYYQNKKLKGLPTNSNQTIYELDEDLIADKDQAIRDKNEAQAEVLSLSNKLKLKNQEVNNKDQQIQRLKKEFGEKDKALNSKITELKEKYSKQGQLLDEEQTDNNKLTEENEKLSQKIKDLEKQLSEQFHDAESGEE